MTTRRIILMRHAKSSSDLGPGGDHGRPLNDRGRRDAPRIAHRIAELGWWPDRVLSSDSARTVETWARMADRLPVAEVEFLRKLYHAGLDEFREVVGEQPDEIRCVLVLGHSPGWEEVVRWLSGAEVEMPTATAVCLSRRRAGAWATALAPRAWVVDEVLRPKEL